MERFLAVVYPLFHKVYIRTKHITAAAASCWFIGLLFNLTSIIITSVPGNLFLSSSRHCHQVDTART